MMKTLLLSIAMFAMLLTPASALTEQEQLFLPGNVETLDIQNGDIRITEDAAATEASQRDLVLEGPNRVLDFLLSFFSIIAVIIGILAGVKIIYSHGNAKQFQEGLMMLVYTALGMLIISGSWFIVRFILNFNL